jgi:hypothetical protein
MCTPVAMHTLDIDLIIMHTLDIDLISIPIPAFTPPKPIPALIIPKPGADYPYPGPTYPELTPHYWVQPRVVKRTDGQMRTRTMAVRSSVTKTHCSVRFKNYQKDKLPRPRRPKWISADRARVCANEPRTCGPKYVRTDRGLLEQTWAHVHMNVEKCFFIFYFNSVYADM